MLTRRTVLGSAFGAGAWGLAPAWAAPLDRKALENDISVLRLAFISLHPGLYRYSTPTEVAARFDALEKDFPKAQSLGEAYLTLSRFLATIRCGHTYANFYNQSKAAVSALFSGTDKLPFQFRWIGDRMVVTRNLSGDAALARGAEVLEIDGRKPSDILRVLMAYARADGSNDAKRRALLEARGLDSFEYFDVFYALLFPPQNGKFRLTAQLYGDTTPRRIEVGALNLAQRRAAMTIADEKSDAPAWILTFTPENMAVLTMPTWAIYDSKWKWQVFLDDAFKEIASRKASGLIVDLRGNEGGLDCGNEVIARLIGKDLPLETYERRVRFRQTPADLDVYLDTWDASFKSLGKDATDLGDGFYRLEPEKNEDDDSLIRPKGPRFNGKVVVLIDSENSSATFQFANTVRVSGLGTLCGEPTGGNQRGINGGSFFFFRLPGSGLEVDLPLVGTFPRTPKPDEGLSPDVPVGLTIADIAQNRDAGMQKAIEIIQRG